MEDPVFKQSGAKEFVAAVNRVREQYQTARLSECVERLCIDSGYEKYIRELGDMERFENLSEFKRIASEYERNYGEEVSLKEFINQISLQSEDDGEENCDRVKLMTIHAAKGLEFPYVFIIGFSEGIFPSSKTIEERRKMGLEEERRLCYVAITRAKKGLFLLDSEEYAQNGKEKLPSRFLKEIGEENYTRVGSISRELQYNADRYAAQLYDEAPTAPPKAAGTRVNHPAFGEGEILGFGRNQNSYRIKFDKLASEREISADFFKKPRALPVLSTSLPETQTQLPQPTEETPKSVEAQSPQQTAEKAQEKELPDHPLNGYEQVDAFKLQTKESVQSTEEKKEPVNEPPQPPNLKDYDNLWNRDDVPKTGWVCTGVTDLGAPVGVCEMCGHQIIRYVHHMFHPDFRSLGVGCICAGKMEGNIERAKKREQEFKSKELRKANFKDRQWKTSKKSNSYLKIKDHQVVLYHHPQKDTWKYAIDGVFCPEVYYTRESAMDAIFEALEKLR